MVMVYDRNLSMNLSDLRKEYSKKGLLSKELNPDPIDQFASWFNEAKEKGLMEPNAMSLGTINLQGKPSIRTVLLKYFDQCGFWFFTNYESDKAEEIDANPAVCLLFPWVPLERQVIIYGQAEKLTREQSKEYFLKRPLNSQLGAWASEQSKPLTSRDELENSYEKAKKRFENEPMQCPPFWGGYNVIPHCIEFWQGRESRLHDRFRYMKDDGDWKVGRLSP